MKLAPLLFLAALSSLALGQKTSIEKTDRNFAEADTTDKWIYNDLPKGFAEAKTSGKPMMVVYRCIP